MKSDLVDIACFVRTETSRAFLINDGHREVWIPKSQCEIERSDDPKKSSVATMPEWLAKSKELI